MGYEENFDNTEVAEDSLPEGFVEESEESEDIDLESFDLDIDDEDSEEEAAEETEDEDERKPQGTSGGRKEPGYVKQRIAEAIEKERPRIRASLKDEVMQEVEATYAPLRERLIELDAQELVRKGEVKDIETAKELVRYRQGLPAAPKGQEKQARDSSGRFASAPKEDPATTARINMLRHQADAIKADSGPDVIAEFQNNPKVKQKVINGEWDFYDVAREMKKAKPKKPSSPMRSPNGATTSGIELNEIDRMSDKEFERLERRVQSGSVRIGVK